MLRDGVRFFAGQRDGRAVIRSVLQRRPSHLNDAHATVYRHPHFERGSDVITDKDLVRAGGPVDVAGGWFDAGDYLKFTHSTAFADVLLYVARRELGNAAPRTLLPEARHGTAWLAKMWRPRTKTLYLQVGIGSGNSRGSFYGDHDGWRLPQRDDRNHARAWRYVAHRPVFLAARPGHLISPNLAGRTAAAFALAAQVDAPHSARRARHELLLAQSLYAMANTASPPHPLISALPFAFYPESTWADDMELGATEIARARRAMGDRASGYIADAARWAHLYLRSQTGDTFNLYDVSALAHADLAGLLGHRTLAVTRHALLADLRRQLNSARRFDDPFAAGVDDREFDVDSHTFGLIATQGWYCAGERRPQLRRAGRAAARLGVRPQRLGHQLHGGHRQHVPALHAAPGGQSRRQHHRPSAGRPRRGGQRTQRRRAVLRRPGRVPGRHAALLGAGPAVASTARAAATSTTPARGRPTSRRWT